MAWANSRIMRPFIGDALGNVSAVDLDADQLMVTLWNNSITPNNNVSAAQAAYGGGVWTGAAEVFEAGQWDQGGEALTPVVLGTGAPDLVTLDAADTESGPNADLANVFGCHIHDGSVSTPVNKPGICYSYFGGTNQVTNGTLRVVWHTSGIFQINLNPT